MIRSIIVEDDIKHAERLRNLLTKTDHFIEIKEICSNIEEAVEAIEKYRPELVFLDIRLQGNDKGGFDLLQKIKDINFDVIFTTAHVEENLCEIRRCGLCFVYKPYIPSDIEDAMKKYGEKQKGSDSKQIKTLISNLVTDNPENKVIFIDFEKYFFPIKIKDILYCTSNNNIITFIIKTENEELNNVAIKIEQELSKILTKMEELKKKGKEIEGELKKTFTKIRELNEKASEIQENLKETKKEYDKLNKIRRHNLKTNIQENKNYLEWDKTMTMKALVADFSGLNFCRIHNEFLINMMHVKKFTSGAREGGLILLSNGESLEVSKQGKNEFLKCTGKT